MYTPDQKRLVVCVYFGSITDFEQNAFTMANVGRMFRMPTNSVRRIVHEFRLSGFDLNCFQRQAKPRFKMLSSAMRKVLLDPQTLQEWSSYSIAERVQLIKGKYDVSISKNILEKFYKASNVKYRPLKWAYRHALINANSIDQKRADFSISIARHIRNGR